MDQSYTVIFDGDGVCIHPWRFANFLANDHGITKELTTDFFTGPFQDCMRDTADLRTVLEPSLADWGWQLGFEKFLEKWLSLEHAPNDEMLSLVKQLRDAGISCCLGSNQDKSRARYIEKEMGFAKLFDHCLFSCDLQAVKPQVEFFEKATQALGVSPESVIFFDDSAGHVSAAKTYGWQAFECTSAATANDALKAFDLDVELPASINKPKQARNLSP